MSNQLIPASYTQTDAPANHSARAISASITTSSGHDLFIAAVSQKKIGQYANGDTPRMALFSFLTGLQSGNESSILDLVSNATSQAAEAVRGFVADRGGAPCSLTVAIFCEQQLFSLQVGTGNIFNLEAGKLKTVNSTHPESWLGESLQSEITKHIAVKKLAESKISIIVCQESFAKLCLGDASGFYKNFMALASENSAETLPSNLADWGRKQKLDQGLTIATLHAETKNFVDFFTLNEALLGNDKTLHTSKQAAHSPTTIAPAEPTSATNHREAVSKTQSINIGESRVKQVVPQASTSPSLEAIKPEEPKISANDYVVFSSANTVPTQAIQAERSAPIRVKTAEPTTKVKSVKVAKAAPINPQAKSSKAPEKQPLYQQLKSFVWPIIAALFTILILLLGFRFVTARWVNQPEADQGTTLPSKVAATQTTDLPPIASGTNPLSTSCVNPNSDNENACNLGVEILNPTATPTAAPTQTPTASPTGTSTNPSTSIPTETLEPTPVPPIGQLIRSADEPITPIEVGEIIITDRLMRITFSAAVSQTKAIDEVYAFPGSVLSFTGTDQKQRFEAEQGTTLFLNSQSEPISALLTAGNWILENKNGCMAIDYSRADRPIIASCYTGTCSWANGDGVKNNLPEGQRIELLAESLSDEAVPNFTTIRSNESLAFYQQLSADSAGSVVANQCVTQYLPSPTAIPTLTPTPTPIPPTPRPPSNSGSNNPNPTSTPPLPTNTIAPTSVPIVESTPTKEQLPERPTATLGAVEPTTIPGVTPVATEENTKFPATSTPTP